MVYHYSLFQMHDAMIVSVRILAKRENRARLDTDF
jgi:hypothetical protein